MDVRNLRYSQIRPKNTFSKACLGDLTKEEPCYGTSAPARERVNDGQPKYIRITDFGEFGIEADHQFMSVDRYTDKHMLYNGDILFARTGGTVGKTFYYDGSIGPAVFAGYCIRFRFDENKVLPRFVYWYTKTDTYHRWVTGIQRPSGQPNINKEEYKSFEIALPDIEKQNDLTRYMDNAYCEYERSIKKADDLLFDAKKGALLALGIDFDDYNPSIYSYSRRKDLENCGIYCNTHSAYLNRICGLFINHGDYAGNLEEYVDVNPGIIRDILHSDTQVSFVPMASVSQFTNEVCYETRCYGGVKAGYTAFQRGDILWAKITPCMQNGKSFIAQNMPTEYGFASTEFHVLRLRENKRNELYMPYLLILLSEKHILEAAQGMFCGSAGQQRVPEVFLKRFPLVLPAYKQQKELADQVENARIESSILKIQAKETWHAKINQFEHSLLGE